jgi:hypothetical protein
MALHGESKLIKANMERAEKESPVFDNVYFVISSIET